MGLGATAAVLVGTVRNRPRHKLPWILLAMALGTFISGDITYDVLTIYLHANNPFPSLADVFYLATYPLFGAGLLCLVRAAPRRARCGALLDALIVVLGAALLSWIYLIQPYVHSHDMSFFVKAVSIAYPVGDLLTLCLLVRLLAGGGGRNAALRLLSLGAVGVLAADCAYGWIQLHGNWKVGGPTDLGWVAFYVLWGRSRSAPVHARIDRETVPPEPEPERLDPAGPERSDPGGAAAPGLARAGRRPSQGCGDDRRGHRPCLFVLVMARLTRIGPSPGGLGPPGARPAGVRWATRGRHRAWTTSSPRRWWRSAP